MAENQDQEKLDYLGDLKIDKYALDQEWIRQPELYQKWAELSAMANILRDQLKNKTELVYAEIEEAVRKDPEKYGNPQTERGIKSAIIRDNRYQAVMAEYFTAKKRAAFLNIAKNNIGHQRKQALKELSDLYRRKYDSKNYIRDPEFDRQEAARALENSMRGVDLSRRIGK